MNRLLLFCILTILFTGPQFVYAGDEIINYMTKVIYEDCSGADIDVSPLGLINTVSGESVPLISWPYDISLIRHIVYLIVKNEPYSVYVGGGGQTILSCNDKNLTVNFYTYKWNGERLDPFIYNVENIANYVANQTINQIANLNGSYKSNLIQSVGDNTDSSINQYNLFSDNNFYLNILINLVASLIVSITILTLIDLLIFKFEYSKKFIKAVRRRVNNKKEKRSSRRSKK